MDDEKRPFWTIPFRVLWTLIKFIAKLLIGAISFVFQTFFDLVITILLAFDIFGLFSDVFEKKDSK